jgi:hypothetical protein
MATTPLTPIVSGFDLTTTYQDIYTVPSDKLGAGIDAVVFNNYTASNVTYSVRLVQSGTASSLNEVIKDKTVRANSNDLAPAMIGQALQTGGIIQAKASANTSVSVNITATTIDS